jgi:hypothetical protein
MYHRPQPAPKHSARYEKEMQRLKRRRPKPMLPVIVGVGAALLLVTIEMGRALNHMREAQAFMESIRSKSNGEIRTDLDKFSLRLTDRNPLVRNAAMAAMKVATGWGLGSDPGEWRAWWERERETFEYHKPLRPGVPPELKQLLEQFTSSIPAQATEPPPATP